MPFFPMLLSKLGPSKISSCGHVFKDIFYFFAACAGSYDQFWWTFSELTASFIISDLNLTNNTRAPLTLDRFFTSILLTCYSQALLQQSTALNKSVVSIICSLIIPKLKIL